MITWKVTTKDRVTGNEHQSFLSAESVRGLMRTSDYRTLERSADVIAVEFWERQAIVIRTPNASNGYKVTSVTRKEIPFTLHTMDLNRVAERLADRSARHQFND